MPANNELLIKINGSAKGFIDEIDRINAKTKTLQKGLSSVAKTSAIGFAALAGAVGATVSKFNEFNKTFTNVQTLLDKSSFSTRTLAEGTEDLRKGILSLGAQSGESFETLNQGLFDLISSGVPAEQAIKTLGSATRLATAGATDTATAVKALAASLTSFGDEAGSAEEISQKFFTAQKFGVTTVGELAKEFNKVAGISKNLGLSFDETLASLSSLTADGAKPTAEAATQLKASLNSIILVQSKLANESEAVRDALSLQNVKQRGLVKSFELLKKATGGNIQEIQRLVGSSEALGVVLSLTGAQSELVKKQIAALGDEAERTATFEAALAIKQEDLNKSLDRLGTSINSVAVVFGGLFAPTIKSAADALTSIAVSFSELDKETLKTLGTITKYALAITGTIAVASTLGLAYLKLKSITLALNAAFGITNKVTAITNGLMIAGRKAAAIFSAGIRLATASVRSLAAATGIGLVLVALSLMAANMKKTKAIAQGTFAAIGAIISKFANDFKGIFGNIGDLLVAVFSFDKDKIQESIDGLKSQLEKGFSDIGTAAAEAYTTAYNESILEDEEAQNEKEEEDNEEGLEKKKKEAQDRANIVKKGKTEEVTFKQKADEAFAKFEDKLNNDQIKAFEANNNALIGLTNSKNKTLKSIGKKAAAAQAAIDTYRGAIAAYQSLAGIPFVGPALGIAAAAAITAYGFERISDINNAAAGGIVPQAGGGARDRVPMMLEPGELVVPRQLRPTFLEQFGRPDDDSGESGGGTEVIIGFKEEAFEIIEQKLKSRSAIGVGGF